MVNTFDFRISAYLNQLCHRHELFDRAIVFLSDNHLLKGGVLVIIIWYIWFSAAGDSYLKRTRIISALVGSFISIFVARILPHVLTYRARPILNPENHFVDAYGLNRGTFDNLSSFPSDHCTLFFALATGICYSSRRWGVISFLYVLAFIAFPRVYLGLHYLTDILCGAAIGIPIVVILETNTLRNNLSARILNLATSAPGIFYSLFFFITFEIGEMFTSVRSIASFILHPLTYYIQ